MQIIKNLIKLDSLDCEVIIKALVHYASDLQPSTREEELRTPELIQQITLIKRELK
tara:strand:+ start:286 stop:453 length:168 start_codon:yes stop_codon:yes gene_type:complete